MQLFLAFVACAACAMGAPSRGSAQTSSEPAAESASGAPWVAASDEGTVVGDGRVPRWLVTAGAGLPVRLRRDRRLGQGRLAPAYAELFAGYLFPGENIQHGLGITATLGLSDDGGFLEPVDALAQSLLGPTYVLGVSLDPAWLTVARVTLPVSVRGDQTVGLDVGATLGYRIFAATGLYAEASAAAFVGLAGRVYPLLSLELGLMVDYEVLP